jgi:pimeloyl-ACP methyl ester carboxylesterase
MADVDGVDIHFQQVGDGPDVVMIHGMATNLAFWWLTMALATRWGLRVTALDLRGHGRSSVPATGYTVPHLAHDVVGLMDAAGIGRAHLVGHSLGGEVALLVAARRPERVSSVTLADTRVRALQRENCWSDWPNRAQIAGRLQRAGIVVPEDDPESGQRLLEELARTGQMHLVHALADGLPPPTTRRFGVWGPRGAAQFMRLLATTDAREAFRAATGPDHEELRRITAPVLAVYGEWSPCLPTFRGLPHDVSRIRRRTVPRAGHFHPVTRPEPFLSALRRFLVSNRTRRLGEPAANGGPALPAPSGPRQRTGGCTC